MYEKAVLRRHSVPYQEFDASVDIWSLGVTIFHVATGHLPFQPYGGRSNSQTMYFDEKNATMALGHHKQNS